jgi:glyoxylase-like metal-dependent hydrolase (beta-lactamase superfamily II)
LSGQNRFGFVILLASVSKMANANFPAGLHTIRGLAGCCHLLREDGAAVLIDTGLVGEQFLLRRLFRKLGFKPDFLKAILLTHGHLDHAGNLAWLKQWSGAKVLAHPEEARHIAGTYPYTGVTKWCGRLETTGRFLFRYRAVSMDEPLADGQELPFWGGLRVIHLPGHTRGHCGFYSARHNLLFSGDMFASYCFSVHQPPPILNSVPELFADSVERVRQLAPRLMLPGHYDYCDGDLHRRRFCRLYRLKDWVEANPPTA